MRLKAFFQKFDQLAGAPDAVQMMRRLIISLATSGRLVRQTAAHNPASALIQHAENERRTSERSRIIAKQKRVSSLYLEQAPYKIPENWCWTRLGAAGVIFNGNSINAETKQRRFTDVVGLPYIATKDVGYGFDHLDYENGIYIPESENRFKVARRNSTFICAEGGSAGRKCGVTTRDVCFGNKLFCNEPLAAISPRYILYWYLSPRFLDLFDAAKTGIIGGVSIAKFIELPLPLPPLEEQKRIVAKADELMALCDRLEAQQQERDTRHAALARASLARFADSPNSANLNLLFHKSYTISPDDLRKSILTLAVQGKLVSQDPKDEAVDTLLTRIKEERQQLIANGELRNSKPRESAHEESIRRSIPCSWRLVRLEELTKGISDGVHKKPNYTRTGVPFITIRDLTAGPGIAFENTRFISESDHKQFIKRTNPERGDILITKDGTIGVVRIVDTDKEFSIFVSVALVKPVVVETNLFIAKAFEAPVFQDQINPKGAALKHLHLVDLRNLLVPLPPLAEQRRIVAKVDQLMVLVDQLETKLNASHASAANLLEAVVAELAP